MPTIITTDITDTLRHFAKLLKLAPAPQPLGACDAVDLDRAANVIGKMRERERELEGEVEGLRKTVEALEEKVSVMFYGDELWSTHPSTPRSPTNAGYSSETSHQGPSR